MALFVVRLGEPRLSGEGLRIGTVRRPPRGVRKEDYARQNYYDVWLPELAPPADLVSWAQSESWTDARWKTFVRGYRKHMSTPEARHLVDLVAAMSHRTNLSVGCYCEDESRCHRSILREILSEAGATMG